MMSDIQITTSTPAQYHLRNKGEWASFIITSGTKSYNNGDDYNWVNVIVSSSFRSMNYFWGHIGENSWIEFLNEPDQMDYFMGKFLTYDEMHEWDIEASLKWAASVVIEARMDGDISKETARGYYDTIVNDIYNEYDFDDYIWGENFFSEHDYLQFRRVKPWVKNFWETLWVPFTSTVIKDKELLDAV